MARIRLVTSHAFRKTVATDLDDAGRTARMVVDQLRHTRLSMNQDVYLSRRALNDRAASILDGKWSGEPSMGVKHGFGEVPPRIRRYVWAARGSNPEPTD